MGAWVDIHKDETHVRRERERARQLRASRYWQELLQQGICHYCGRKFPDEQLTMDHVVPVARGGRSVRGNVVPCCREMQSAQKLPDPGGDDFGGFAWLIKERKLK